MSADETLSSLLDLLIPPCSERRMPGAGALGLGGQLRENAPELVPLIDGGLAALNEAAGARGAASFGSLDPDARVAVVQELSEAQPMLLPALLFHLYRIYYAQPQVLGALGMPPRPPYPEGYEIAPSDFTLLDGVRSRGKLYRDV